MEDWDLQAIVRGCTSEFSKAIMEDNLQYSCYVENNNSNNYYKQENDFLYGLSNCFGGENTSVLDELDELYKPFYPQEEIKELPNQDLIASSGSIIVPRRRKSQHKRVVKQVTVEGLSSDTWAWRKYGQKPIKGSPYPRSYYRCSSSKGCLARKHVEQSHLDPKIFIVSYTSEHNHSHPIRRNTLAGVAKKKSSTINIIPTISSPISSTNVFYPTYPLMTSFEPEQHDINGKKTEEKFKDSMMVENVLCSSFERLDWAY